MGMLGAMAGLGKGLQDFSTLMNEKSKMDWMAQQEAVKHERALSLEALRNQNQINYLGKQQEFQSKERIAGQEFLSKENQIKEFNEQARANSAEALAYEQLNQRDSQVDKEHTYRLQEISAQKAAQLDTAKKLSKFSLEQDETKRSKMIAEVEKSADFQNLPPEYQRLVRMQANPLTAPIATAVIAASSKTGVEFTGRDLVAFEKNTMEKWDALGKDGQEALQEQLNAKEIQQAKAQGREPYVFDAADTKAVFTGMEFKALKDLAGNSRGSALSGMLSGPKVQATTDATPAETTVINTKAVDKISSDIKNGKLTLASVMDSGEFSEREIEMIMQKAGVSGNAKGTDTQALPDGRYEWPGGYGIRPYPPPKDFKPWTSRDIPVVGRILRDSDRQSELLNK